MKMTYAEIRNRHANLIVIGKLTLPRKVSVAIARNIIKFEKEMEVYEEQREDIAGRYAAKDGDGKFILDAEGKNYTFESQEKEAAFRQESKELNESEIDIDIMTFKASELDRCDEVERYNILPPVQEAAIGWMIDYDDEADDLT